MKFLDGLKVAVLFTRCHYRRDRENQRDAMLGFELPITPGVGKALPKAFQDALGVMFRDGGLTYCEIDTDVQHRTLSFQAIEGGPVSLRVHDTSLGQFHLEKISKGTGSDIVLAFRTDLPLTRDVIQWAGDNFGNQIWLEIAATQPDLIQHEAE